MWDEGDIDEMLRRAEDEDEVSDDEETPVAIPAIWPTAGSTPGNEGVGMHPKTPSYDHLNNPLVRVIHTNSIHHLALLTCECCGNESATDLIHCRFMPASFIHYRTLFTLDFLDFQRLANLEMKVSIVSQL